MTDRSPFAFVPLALLALAPAASDDGGRVIAEPPAVPALRDRVEVVNRVLRQRLDTLLPRLMRETGIDLWIVLNREYAEDPVYLTLVPEPVFSARRTTMLVFFDRGPEKGVERLTVSRYPLGDLYAAAWEGGSDDAQWAQLARVIAERDPKRIGIDTSRSWAFGDGLSSGLRDRLLESLVPELRSRVTSAEKLCIRWLETRTPEEVDLWKHAVAIARGVVSQAFSSRVVTPGATTTQDVEWWIREQFEARHVAPWFHPHVEIQRRGTVEESAPFLGGPGTIQRGDVLHCDVGLRLFRLATDTQEMGYVLRAGETEVPEGLRNALAVGNRWQDLLTAEFRTGRTGNEILAATRAAAEKAGIRCSVYTHPLGFHGHAAGPTIGMWDEQGPTPVRGDWPLAAWTGYAIEGNVRVDVPEWDGQAVQIALEQSAWFDGEVVRYLAGRQTRWHVIE